MPATQRLTLTLGQFGSNLGVDLSKVVENLSFSNVMPGGFGNLSGRVRMLKPAEIIQHLQPVTLTDPAGRVLFEGRVEDIRPSGSENEAGFEFEAFGYRRQLDFTPYQKLFVARSMEWEQIAVATDPSVVRQERIVFNDMNWDQTNLLKTGPTIEIMSGFTVLTSQFNGFRFRPATALNMRRLRGLVDYTTTATAVTELRVYSIDSAGNNTLQSTITGTATGATLNTALPANTEGVMVLLVVTTGATPSANIFGRFYDMRILGDVRGTQDEPVYGHHVLADVADACGLKFATWHGDTSFSIPNAFWPDSALCSDVLNEVSAYYTRYWAVWEDQVLHWPATDFSTIDWTLNRRRLKSMQLDRTIGETASAARIRWNGADGRNYEQTVTDTRAENVWRAAGATKIDVVDLGRSASAAAAQVGAVYFPDRSYPVVRGTVTLAADERCGVDGAPAYAMRSGDMVRISDAFTTQGPLLSAGQDRQSMFQIKNVSVEWESQTVTLDLDNSADRLTTLLARSSAELQGLSL